MTDLTDKLADALEELFAMVKGECPSLLNEDSGGDAKLCIAIEEVLTAYRAQQDGEELPEWAIEAAGKILKRISQDSVPTMLHVMGMQYILAQIIVDEFRRPLAKGEA